jgi:hypothetical protein
MRYTFLIAIISLIFFACKKVSFSNAPHIYLKSVNTDTLTRSKQLIFTFTLTDLQGDGPDTLYVQKINPYCTKSSSRDSFALPFFPPARKTKADFTVVYDSLDAANPMRTPQCGYNDTCYYQFVMTDLAYNKSDTVRSGTIIIIK